MIKQADTLKTPSKRAKLIAEYCKLIQELLQLKKTVQSLKEEEQLGSEQEGSDEEAPLELTDTIVIPLKRRVTR